VWGGLMGATQAPQQQGGGCGREKQCNQYSRCSPCWGLTFAGENLKPASSSGELVCVPSGCVKSGELNSSSPMKPPVPGPEVSGHCSCSKWDEEQRCVL
jgi:hypothetical protein